MLSIDEKVKTEKLVISLRDNNFDLNATIDWFGKNWNVEKIKYMRLFNKLQDIASKKLIGK